jgi:starch phosphorylase
MRRQARDYQRGLYLPAAAQHARVSADNEAGARSLALFKQRVRRAWAGVALRALVVPVRELHRGDRLRQRVAVALNGLSPEDVAVEFFASRTLPRTRHEWPALASFGREEHESTWRARLTPTGEVDSDGSLVYELDTPPPASGQFAFELRVRPEHPMMGHPLEMGLLKRL